MPLSALARARCAARALLPVLPCLLACLLAPPVAAETAFPPFKPGLSAIESTLAARLSDSAAEPSARISADFDITPYHGMQFDLMLDQYPRQEVGTLELHLYLQPEAGLRYGLFASYADESMRNASIAATGAEVIFPLGAANTVLLKGGIGLRRPQDFDFFFLQGALDHALPGGRSAYARFSLADYEEKPYISATGYALRVGLRQRLRDWPVELDLALSRAGLMGDDHRAPETRLHVGLTVHFGARGKPARPMFAPAEPFLPLQLTGFE